MEIKLKYIEVTQPIGTFYLCKMNAKDLGESVDVLSRKDSREGIQRVRSSKRIKEISTFCEDPDATFPTSIIISVDEKVDVKYEGEYICLSYEEKIGDIIDGQHRLYGILKSGKAENFELPIVLMIHPTIEEKAYVFSIINSKQEKVDKSLIYDLFDVSSERSPQKTVHDIARLLNELEHSPFRNRLKMLGVKEENQENAILSQGTFSKRLLKLITNTPDQDRINLKNGRWIEPDSRFVFRQYFIDDRDDVILKILLNCYGALKKVFIDLWEKPQSNILWKTTGFNAVMDSIPQMVKLGIKRRTLRESFFEEIFNKLKGLLLKDNKQLTSEDFGSGEQPTTKLKNYIAKAIDNND